MASIRQETSLVEHEDHWDLPLDRRAVTRCWVDHAFGLQFCSSEAEFELRIEGPFHLETPSGEQFSMNPEDTASLGPALRLFQEEVISARAFKNGELEVLFEDNSILRVAFDREYEAWEWVGAGQRVVCMPGGKLAVWFEPPVQEEG